MYIFNEGKTRETSDDLPACRRDAADGQACCNYQGPRKPGPPRNSARPLSSSSYSLSPAQMGDREVKRKKRVATYKAYAIEGRLKASIRRSLHWVKQKYAAIVHGY